MPNLERENADLRSRLAEAQEALRALASGEVDALVIPGPEGDQVFTLKGADEAYRVMVEGMAEGAVTLTREGLIVFANEQFANLVRMPLERVIGRRFAEFVADVDAEISSELLKAKQDWKAELRLRAGALPPISVYISVQSLKLNGEQSLCLIVTDLSEQKRNQEIIASEKLARSILRAVGGSHHGR